jgi:glucokinase
MILAGDIGGTHARLAFFESVNGHFKLVSASVFPSREYANLDAIAMKFVAAANIHPDAACFGIAGPVRNGRVETSNLPWIIESKALAEELRVPKTFLINDLEANAWGIATLDQKDVVPLNQVSGTPVGNQAVIAAGTGLGEAGMYWDGTRHHVFAGEGGHADFAPNNELEIELLRYLTAQFGHVSCERVLSGPGLVNIFHFLRDTKRGVEPNWLSDEIRQGDPAAAISRAAMEAKSSLAEQTLEVFISIYAAEAGNLALKLLATGGLYLGGGIAPKILPKLKQPEFMKIFVSKGRMQGLMESMPVKVITNDSTALFGAARCAAVSSAA